MSFNPFDAALEEDDNPFDAALRDDMPQVGVTLEGLDADAAAQELSGFRSISDPSAAFGEGYMGNGGVSQTPIPQSQYQPITGTAGSPQWGVGPNASWDDQMLEGLGDFGQRAAMSATMGYGDEMIGAMGGDQQAVRDRVQLAKERSPGYAMAGDIAGGVAMALPTAGLAAGATRALPLAGRVAAGMGLAGEQAALTGAGYADDGDRWEAAFDDNNLGPAMMFGAGGELAASGAQGAGKWIGDTAAPWLREQGLMNRVASTGRPMPQLTKELGGRQGVLDAGQWMENQGMTQWSPNALQSNLEDFSSMRTGDQRNFLDELGENPNAYPVNTGRVAGDLSTQGDALEALAPSSSKLQGGQYQNEAQNLMSAAPSGSMPFEDAWRNRQGFDQGSRWQQGAAGDQGLAEVNRDAANGMRGAMNAALENTSPELAPRWDAIQGDLSNSITLSGGGDAAMSRELGSGPTPLNLRSMAAAAGGGPMAYMGAVAAQTGGRGAVAGTMGGMSRMLGGVDGSLASGAAEAGGLMGAQAEGRQEGAIEKSRGYLLPQAAQQMMQEPGALGKFEKQFWDAANSSDSNAISQLIIKLSHTDNEFRSRILPQLQKLTAAEY